jgi:hypothetical protein
MTPNSLVIAMAHDDRISPSLIIGLRLPFARKEEEHDEDHLGYGDDGDRHYSDERPEGDALARLFEDLSSDDDAVAEDARVCALSIARCLQDGVRASGHGDKAALKRQFQAACKLIDRYMSDEGEQGGNHEDYGYGR